MAYKILYCIYKNERQYDCWLWSIIIADSKQQAKDKLIRQCERKNLDIRYIIRIKEVKK